MGSNLGLKKMDPIYFYVLLSDGKSRNYRNSLRNPRGVN